MNIQELLDENSVIFDMKSNSKVSAIKEMVDVLDKNNKLNNKDMYLKAVLEREEEFSTGIGFGIAIPHGKSSAVKMPSLVFAKSISGIDYDSFDNKLVNLLFLIAVPENSNDTHLKILSNLSRKLMHQEIREALINANSYEDIINIINNKVV